jgi:hypothetical protein
MTTQAIQPTNGITRANAGTAVGQTVAVGSTQPAQPPAQQPSSPPKKVKVTGYGSAVTVNNAQGSSSRFGRDATFDNYVGGPSSPVQRGFIRVDAQPLKDGARIHVRSFHSAQNDKVTLYLIAEVLDVKTKELKTITLSVLANADDLNGKSYQGDNYFDLSYDDVNKFLQARNPALKINPGNTTFAVSAVWATGHNAGGFARGGAVRLPPAAGTQAASAVSSTARNNDTADLPLDMEVPYPQAMVQQITQLAPDGDIDTRLESEFKGNSSKQEMTAAILKMYGIAASVANGDKREIERILGKGWTVETPKRFWLKDDGSPKQPGSAGTGFFAGYRVDADGLPLQDPMRDTYMDDQNLTMTRHQGAIRLRTNKQATQMNIKPGGGRMDPKTRITQRIEVGLDLKPEMTARDGAAALQALNSGQWAGTIFNHAQREVAKLDRSLNLANSLNPWLDVVQDRHKFTIKNEASGVEVEFSLDRVKTKTLRPEHADASGAARTAEYFVLEAELDHLQLASRNQSAYTAAGVTQSSHFPNDASQDQWLKAASPTVTLDIDPRLHELEDLENKSFRATSSYKHFEHSVGKLVPELFPSGMAFGRQKAAHSADIMGLVFFDDAKLMAGAQRAVRESGYDWSAATQKAVQAAISNPQQRVTLENMLANPRQTSVVYNTLSNIGAQNLSYDAATLKQRVTRELRAIGFDTNAAVDALIDKIPGSSLNAANFERALQTMANSQDAQVLNGIAQALREKTPAPTPSVKRLLGDSAYGRTLRDRLQTAFVDPAAAPKIEAFLEKAVANGASIWDVRTFINGAMYYQNLQGQLDQIGQARSIQNDVPKLKSTGGQLLTLARQGITNQQILVDAGLEAFIAKVAAASTLAEGVGFAQSLNADASTAVTAAARRIGAPAPKLSFDYALIDKSVETVLQTVNVAYDAELKKFVRAAMDAGVQWSVLQSVFTQLGNSADLAALLKANRIYIVGVPIPTITYDTTGLEASVRGMLTSLGAAVPDQKTLEQYCKQLTTLGMTPQQVRSFVQYSMNYGRRQAAQYYAPALAQTSIPALKLDVDELCKLIAQRWGNQWTAAHEAYVKSAWSKAEASQDFPPGQLVNMTPQQAVATVAQHSGVAKPNGI